MINRIAPAMMMKIRDDTGNLLGDVTAPATLLQLAFYVPRLAGHLALSVPVLERAGPALRTAPHHGRHGYSWLISFSSRIHRRSAASRRTAMCGIRTTPEQSFSWIISWQRQSLDSDRWPRT